MTKRLYRTLVTVEILSDGPIEDTSLSEIDYEITTGNWSGLLSQTTSQQLTHEQSLAHCATHGSDPAFFDLLEDEDEDEHQHQRLPYARTNEHPEYTFADWKDATNPATDQRTYHEWVRDCMRARAQEEEQALPEKDRALLEGNTPCSMCQGRLHPLFISGVCTECATEEDRKLNN